MMTFLISSPACLGRQEGVKMGGEGILGQSHGGV